MRSFLILVATGELSERGFEVTQTFVNHADSVEELMSKLSLDKESDILLIVDRDYLTTAREAIEED